MHSFFLRRFSKSLIAFVVVSGVAVAQPSRADSEEAACESVAPFCVAYCAGPLATGNQQCNDEGGSTRCRQSACNVSVGCSYAGFTSLADCSITYF